MASKLLCLVLLTIACAVNSATLEAHAKQPSSVVLKSMSPTVAPHPRKNLAYAVRYSMNKEILITGLDRLQYLLDYNTNNTELLQDMNRTFQKHSDYTWHLVLEDVAAGESPEQYAFYRFDRNNTELFVGGYRKC